MYVNNLNMIKYTKLNSKTHVITKVRYNDLGSFSIIQQFKNQMKVSFLSNTNITSSGQSAVFYENEDVIGGGFISSFYK